MELHLRASLLIIIYGLFSLQHISCEVSEEKSSNPNSDTATDTKGVITILVSCIALITVAFLVTLSCYFYRRKKFTSQNQDFSSDKDGSYNSDTSLIRHWKVQNTSHVAGFARKLLLMFATERGIIPGSIMKFSFLELEKATEKFSETNLVGVGGTSFVYRGRLKDGKVVAIKRLRLQRIADDYEFLTEIELISRLNHCNLVPLIGYCSEYIGKKFERLLVFEYMSNGNLRECLDSRNGKEAMDWPTRVGIALGAARGLEYLHESAYPRILHRDIKSSNILLNDNYKAKITDFGMAKHLMNDDLVSTSSSPARMLGTFGYFAPEYAIVGKASLKSDVFSFGVVILELISGRQPVQKSPNKSDESLVIWANARIRDNKLIVEEIADKLLKGNFLEEEMLTMARLARQCLQWDPDSRPTMTEVVQVLSTIDKSIKKLSSSSLLTSCALCEIPRQVQQMDVYQEQAKNVDAVLSIEYPESLIFKTESSRSWRSEGEIVHLTEPRFECFLQVNDVNLNR